MSNIFKFRKEIKMAWYWIVLIVYVSVCVVISVLGVFLKPLGGIAKILWTSWKFLIEFFYIILVWWWLAIIQICRHRNPPKVRLFEPRKKAK